VSSLSAAKERPRPRPIAPLLVVWLLLAAAVLAFAARDLTTPGLYYDEAIHAGPARALVEDAPPQPHLPGARDVELFGRRIPWMTMTYLGALKSLALVPVFAVFGADVVTLRSATLAFGLLGLLVTLLAADRILGRPAAVAGGALLALDPTFVFMTRSDYGPVALALVCRAGVVLAAVAGWRARRPAPLFAAGLLAGLGLYHKIDFGLSLAALGLALLVVHPRVVLDAWRARRRVLVPAALGLLLGLAPLLPALPNALGAAAEIEGAAGSRLGLLRGVSMTLDGSHFFRLIASGGRVERLADVAPAPGTLLGVLLLASFAHLVLRARPGPAIRVRRGGLAAPHERGWLFVTLACVFGLGGLFLLPGAQHAHHVMNVHPLPHLAVGASLAAAWGGRGPRLVQGLRRGVVAAVVAVAVLASVQTSTATWRLLAATGGRGWWSDALARFATEIDAETTPFVVSLDWGFHENLAFLRPDLTLREPTWKLTSLAQQRRGSWSFYGGPGTLYLFHPEPFDLLGFGPAFRDALGELDPSVYRVRRHEDRTGAPAFLSVELRRDHRLGYRGTFAFELDPVRPESGTDSGSEIASDSGSTPAASRGSVSGGSRAAGVSLAGGGSGDPAPSADSRASSARSSSLRAPSRASARSRSSRACAVSPRTRCACANRQSSSSVGCSSSRARAVHQPAMSWITARTFGSRSTRANTGSPTIMPNCT